MADPRFYGVAIPSEWGDALERLSRTRVGLDPPPSKAAMLRSGLRLYLQQRLPEEWHDLDLGPPPEIVQPPEIPIESTATDLPDPPEELT